MLAILASVGKVLPILTNKWPFAEQIFAGIGHPDPAGFWDGRAGDAEEGAGRARWTPKVG